MERSRIILISRNPPPEGQQWESDTLLRIGRIEGMEILLDHPSVSRRHAEVAWTVEGWVVRDLGSMNGTFLNGVRVGRADQPVQPRDLIRCGEVQLIVQQITRTDRAPHRGEEGERLIRAAGYHVRVQGLAPHFWEESVAEWAAGDSRHGKAGKCLLTLLRAGYHLGHATALGELLDSVLNDAVTLFQAQRGLILLSDDLSGKLRLEARGVAGPPAGTEKALGKALARRCFVQGQSLLCRDFQGVRSRQRTKERASTASILCALLRTPRKRLGVLYLDRGPAQEEFTPEDFFLADALAASASIGIESAQLLKLHRDQAIYTVTALAQAVEMRDQYTGGHTQRVTNYSLMLAEELKLATTALHQLRIGTPLHDIGKIGIDDAILRKPGKLTPEEFEQMKLHTVKGAAILEAIPDLTPLLPIIRSHHERWDGRGYPDSLSGDSISPLARIVAVADAFDAMTSDRPYRPALSVDQAFTELVSQSGAHFDPACIQAFLCLRPRVQIILEQEGSLRRLSGQAAKTFGFDLAGAAKEQHGGT
jgi:HD-GYP domain-containing protein (c-di-GMP phosphodiesterase class II)